MSCQLTAVLTLACVSQNDTEDKALNVDVKKTEQGTKVKQTPKAAKKKEDCTPTNATKKKTQSLQELDPQSLNLKPVSKSAAQKTGEVVKVVEDEVPFKLPEDMAAEGWVLEGPEVGRQACRTYSTPDGGTTNVPCRVVAYLAPSSEEVVAHVYTHIHQSYFMHPSQSVCTHLPVHMERLIMLRSSPHQSVLLVLNPSPASVRNY